MLYMTIIPVAEARQSFSALVETLDVLADAAAMRDVAQSRADSKEGRYLTAAEMEKILAARAQGIDLGDDADVVAEMHARGLPDVVCVATLDALISTRRRQER